ncbi:MAG TPA: LytR C-terminal domain-containing protein [Actinomycetota bacterium]|nr:LytR C-terminal domain-containing protein [Actinomycetota bacterium]
MAGKHEPSSGQSFYLSLSTAALRAMLVVGAVVLGIFVLAKAFPTGGERPIEVPPAAEPRDEVTEPPPDDGQGGGGGDGPPARPPDLSGLELQVLNGTDVSNLAGCTAQALEQGETFQDVSTGDSSQPYERSTIFHLRRATAEAEYLQRTYFQNAQLMSAASGAEAPVSVVLGEDYADDPLPGVSDCLG